MRPGNALDPSAAPMPLGERTPVLVGAGVAAQRDPDPRSAREPIALMVAAAQSAGVDCGSAQALAEVQRILVPKGRWSYANPAEIIGRAIGARQPATVLSTVGVLQQSLIADACARIAQGEIESALVVGGDAGHRLSRAAATGIAIEDADTSQAPPDLTWAPHDELRHPAEIKAGLHMPVGLYAIMHSALQAARGHTVDAHRDAIARLYSGFSAIAASNPNGWRRAALPPSAIREATVDNPMQAFPYTKLHCSNWSVDQAGALLLCSVRQARALGIAPSRWVFPLASTESNHMVSVVQRAHLGRCAAAGIAGRAALDAAGLSVSQLERVDLYSCFPFAVDVLATELGLPSGEALTVTGGMPYAGGPYNNYVLQATARMVHLLRQGHGGAGLVASVSGAMTKQGFGLWSRSPGRERFVHANVTSEAARSTALREVRPDYRGRATVAGYTVLHRRGSAPCGVVIADTADGYRTVARSDAPAMTARMQSERFCGTPIHVHAGSSFTLSI